MSEYFRDDLV